ncbi:hypothetical protein DUNSADRAFT_4848 [Dunaliella salina]|uniref:Secreted protein n=1 Tax=Dunaliella salina TaxID=3046 RepID=A0ABQ7FUM2_DUNSA|nr:hypothetical protein DUNSADRAFT_4848 [Dunaliella salina]|eukprot:KAF5826104.1 hypothetical protein DUNSADRAFT_4848 [Dunaliella salina]
MEDKLMLAFVELRGVRKLGHALCFACTFWVISPLSTCRLPQQLCARSVSICFCVTRVLQCCVCPLQGASGSVQCAAISTLIIHPHHQHCHFHSCYPPSSPQLLSTLITNIAIITVVWQLQVATVWAHCIVYLKVTHTN